MRTSLGVLVLLAAALLVAPLSAATSAPAGDADRVASHHSVRVETVRDRVITLTNNKRRAHGCRNLAKNGALSRAAQKHTKKMADYFSSHPWDPTLAHRLPGEPYFTDRFEAAGYRNWTDAAENVDYNAPTARAVVRAWMNSPVHRANILNCRFKHIGVGFARATDGTPYWTQDFGRK